MADKKTRAYEEKGIEMREEDGAQVTLSMIAKKGFEIHHNEFHRVIKEGDDLSDVPAIYHANLKTEGVI